MTQLELSRAAQVPLRDIQLVESGQVGKVKFDRTRAMFIAVGGGARITTWWNGAAADRLLDERHARIVERVVSIVQPRGWMTPVEVTFSEYGERGSIDVLAGRADYRAVAVFEIKADIGSMEEMNRVLDVKERLAPKLAMAQFGWRPTVVARILVLPEDLTLRRLIGRHANTMRSIYPAGSREVRAWLRKPDGQLRGIWFLSEVRNTPSRTD